MLYQVLGDGWRRGLLNVPFDSTTLASFVPYFYTPESYIFRASALEFSLRAFPNPPYP